MCKDCGCSGGHKTEVSGIRTNGTIKIIRKVMHENDMQAIHNRQHFSAHDVMAINIMSSPGAGKTSLLEQTIRLLGKKYKIAVIEGDLETEKDAIRIRNQGVQAVQINTVSACHLDASMVHDAIHDINLNEIDILFIENIGNLVCPASFDLGQYKNVVMLSVTEGDDKPAKYPVMFRSADVLLISKGDLMPYMETFRLDTAEQGYRNLAKTEPVIVCSVKNQQGMHEWIVWIETQLNEFRNIPD